MNSYITKIIKNIISKPLPQPLGRWNINYCNKEMNRKIDLSNEDHCGPCGEYAIKQIVLQNKDTIESKKMNENPKK